MDQSNSETSEKSVEVATVTPVATAEATSVTSARYEKTSQKVTEDLSLKEIARIFTSNWVLFLIILTAFSASAVGVYYFRIPFVSNGSIIVNDSQNSSLQSFATQFFGLTKNVAEGKKSNSPLQKHIEYLKTEEFFKQYLSDIQEAAKSESLSLAEKRGYQIFKENILAETMSEEQTTKVLQALDSMLKTKISSDFEIKVSVQADQRELALFLENVALKTISENLRQRELIDIIKVETFIRKQRADSEERINEINTKMADFQKKPENLISLASKDKVGEYLSELMVRKNEVKMKIAENNKIIDLLSQGRTNRRESQLYGSGGRIQALKIENDMHQAKLSDIQASIDRVTNQAKAIPVATQTYEDLKKKSDIEFKNYKDLTENLAKVEAQRLSVQSKYEVLEAGRIENVAPLVSLPILLMLALVISQIVGSFIIYIIYIWDSNSVTAHSSRDIVIIDSHNLDPRVIMENTKIKFRLRHGISEGQDNGDSDSGNKKLSFNIFKRKDANGEDYENL